MNRLDPHLAGAFLTLGSTVMFAGILLGHYLAKDRARWQQTLGSRKPIKNSSNAEHEIDGLSGLEDSGLEETQSGNTAISQGIESCIGNTPLFKIKSLSDATGCEILGKAEVRLKACVKV